MKLGSAEKRKTADRLGWLDFGKAMGILVVLLVHAGCRLGLLTFYGGMFYMPIFFVASGYTFRIKEGERYGDFLWKKAKRLLLPYIGTSGFLWLFFWIKDCLLAGDPGNLKPRSLFGILYARNQMWQQGYAGENPVLMDLLNSPLWFLTALFLVYAWYGLISKSRKKELLLAVGLAVSMLWHYLTPLLLPWSLDAVPYFAIFFAAGEKLRAAGGIQALTSDRKVGIGCVNLFLLLGFVCGSVNLSCGNYGVSMLAYLGAGILGSFSVFAVGAWLEEHWKHGMYWCTLVGQQTMPILCFHMFLYMFLQTAAGIAGLHESLTKTVMVAGSMVLLCLAGTLWNRRKEKKDHGRG